MSRSQTSEAVHGYSLHLLDVFTIQLPRVRTLSGSENLTITFGSTLVLVLIRD